MNKVEKKKWVVKTLENKKVSFFPIFVSDTQGETKCTRVKVKIDENEYTFNYLDLLLFCYFIGDEEQRRKLSNITMKTVREIPYDVSFKIDDKEKRTGIARRRIILPIDELMAAYYRNEAQKEVMKKRLKL